MGGFVWWFSWGFFGWSFFLGFEIIITLKVKKLQWVNLLHWINSIGNFVSEWYSFEVYSSKQWMLRTAQSYARQSVLLILVLSYFLVYPEIDFSQAAECKWGLPSRPIFLFKFQRELQNSSTPFITALI